MLVKKVYFPNFMPDRHRSVRSVIGGRLFSDTTADATLLAPRVESSI